MSHDLLLALALWSLLTENRSKIERHVLCLKYRINLFVVFHYLVKVAKNEKIICLVYSLFTEKVNFLLVNKEKKNLS